MIVFVLPVSGGYMPAQLALLTNVLSIDIKPDKIYSSSGGNISACIAIACDFNAKKIKPFLQEMSDSVQIKQNAYSRLKMIIQMFSFSENKPLYSIYGMDSFFNKHITSERLNQVELYTGTYNRLSGKSIIFCNKPTNVSEHYNASDSYCIAQASATIPMFLEDVLIDGEPYIDGGIQMSSPAIDLLPHIAQENEHIWYILGSNVHHNDIKIWPSSTINETLALFSAMTTGYIRLETTFLINRFKSMYENYKYILYEKATLDTLKDVKNKSIYSTASLVIIYPFFNRNTSLYDISYKNIVELIDITNEHWCIELYYF